MTTSAPLPSRYPCDATRQTIARRVLAGRQKMRAGRVVLCGLARDVEDVFPATAAALERLGSLFSDYRVVLYENDSTDRTPFLLQAWAGMNSRVSVLSEKLDDPINPPIRCLERAARMASYRNRYLEFIAERYADFDFAIVIDTDLGSGWDENGIASTFGYDDWDFVGSNGILYRHDGVETSAVHYDAWAFRSHVDFRPLSTRKVNRLQLMPGDGLLPVYSCFGGLGVYHLPALLSSRYSGEDCEHVTLHRGMRSAGFDRTFLNSDQVVHYGLRHVQDRRFWRRVARGWSFAARRHVLHAA